MVIYERESDWVMTPQHNHSLLSGEIAKSWNPAFFDGASRWDDVVFAISEHDRGWIDLDETPFWNDQIKAPYSFIDFPTVPRITFYKKGIDEVERQSSYAGLLCSMHYQSFVANAKDTHSTQFFEQEEARQSKLKKQLNIKSEQEIAELHTHLQMTQFCDSLSLYLCMQEPGIRKEKEHPWFRHGFSEIFPFANGKKIIAEWVNSKTVSLHPFPLKGETTVSIHVKEVRKEDIDKHGIALAYKETGWERRTFLLVGR